MGGPRRRATGARTAAPPEVTATQSLGTRPHLGQGKGAASRRDHAGCRLGRKSKQRSPCQRKRDVDGRERPRRTAAENTRRRARAARPPRWGGSAEGPSPGAAALRGHAEGPSPGAARLGGDAEGPSRGPSEGAVPASTSTSAALSHAVRGVCHSSPRTLVPVQAHAHEPTELRCPLRPRPTGAHWGGRPHGLVPEPPPPPPALSDTPGAPRQGTEGVFPSGPTQEMDDSRGREHSECAPCCLLMVCRLSSGSPEPRPHPGRVSAPGPASLPGGRSWKDLRPDAGVG